MKQYYIFLSLLVSLMNASQMWNFANLNSDDSSHRELILRIQGSLDAFYAHTDFGPKQKDTESPLRITMTEIGNAIKAVNAQFNIKIESDGINFYQRHNASLTRNPSEEDANKLKKGYYDELRKKCQIFLNPPDSLTSGETNDKGGQSLKQREVLPQFSDPSNKNSKFNSVDDCGEPTASRKEMISVEEYNRLIQGCPFNLTPTSEPLPIIKRSEKSADDLVESDPKFTIPESTYQPPENGTEDKLLVRDAEKRVVQEPGGPSVDDSEFLKNSEVFGQPDQVNNNDNIEQVEEAPENNVKKPKELITPIEFVAEKTSKIVPLEQSKPLNKKSSDSSRRFLTFKNIVIGLGLLIFLMNAYRLWCYFWDSRSTL